MLNEEVEPLHQTEVRTRHCIERVYLIYVFICHIEEFFLIDFS